MKQTYCKLIIQFIWRYEKSHNLHTRPGTAVQFDSHTDGSWMTRVRHEANPSRDDDRTQFTQLGEVRVTVARQQLQPRD